MKKSLGNDRTIIPPVPCDEGCSDCCCPVPFSKREWAAIPLELKRGLDIRMSINFTGRLMSIPFQPDFLPPGVPHLIPQYDMGKVMRCFQEDEIPNSCPFCVEKRCVIYELRPLICRIHGTVGPDASIYNRLTCPRGRVPTSPLTKEEINKLYLDWLLNERTWQEA